MWNEKRESNQQPNNYNNKILLDLEEREAYSGHAVNKSLLQALSGTFQTPPPIWLMRQAGRYLPEYRKLRARAGSFLNLVYSPKLAAEATLQPIRRFGFDAAIIFSDILVIPHALGQSVTFEAGEGPRLEPIEDRRAFERLSHELNHKTLQPVYETVALVKEKLDSSVALIGFCGAPWTVATYMIAGRSTPDQAPARLFAYGDRAAFNVLIDVLVDASTDYLVCQLQAGVDAVQIFDTWAGVLPPEEFVRWCVEPTRQIVEKVRSKVPDAKVIGFPRGAGTRLRDYVRTVPVDGIGLDWAVDRKFVRDNVPTHVTLQGNLDPLALLAGSSALDRGVDAVLEAFADRPFIFNLGHGILPETPVAHVEQMLKRVRMGR